MSDSSPPKILVVDDDVKLCEMIASYLSTHEFSITVCHSGDAALTLIRQFAPDLVILDLMLPGVDGLSVCREVRGDFGGRILMLTALDDTADEITGLEIGADDYLAKPVSPRLLLARVRTLLRRPASAVPDSSDRETVAINDLIVDISNREVSLKQQVIRMTTTEFDLLWILASNAGKPLSREYLHEQMYHLDLVPSDRRIDLLVSRLRKKLSDDTATPVYIKTVRGKGYQMGSGK